MKKKLIAVLVAACLSVGLFGCNTTKGLGEYGGGLKLTIESDKNAAITTEGSYKLKYTLSAGKASVSVKGTDGASDVTVYGSYSEVGKTFTASRPGVYTLTVSAAYGDENASDSAVVTVTAPENGGKEETVPQYPADPAFNTLQARPDDYTTWTEFGAHDPSVIQVDGVYYAFSTDVDGTQNGYQIRTSADGIHWKYLKTAFSPEDMEPTKYLSGNGELQDVFDTLKNNNADTCVNAATGKITLWAPDIVLGNDGMFWLYYSVTSYFGSSKSYLGLAKSYKVDGPYKHVACIYKNDTDTSRNYNAIDPQVIFAENDPSKDMYLSFGSFKGGIAMLKLDRTTGLRDEAYNEGAPKRLTGTDGMSNFGGEGSVIAYAKDVPVMDGEGVFTTKNFYYMFISDGNLTSTYNMKALRSENIDGPYTDYLGNEMASSTNNGDKVMGSFQFLFNGTTANKPVDFYAPGHNDLFTNAAGVNLVAYHCRATKVGDNMHYLYTSQYFYNEDGRLVMNPNRWAGDGESLRDLTAGEILGSEGALRESLTEAGYESGLYKMIRLTASRDTVESTLIKLTQEETEDGYKIIRTADGETADAGSWKLYGGEGRNYYVTLTIDGETYKGVAVPSWLTDQSRAGICITALSTTTGRALYLNMAVQ